VDASGCPAAPSNVVRVVKVAAAEMAAVTNTTINGIEVNSYMPSVVDLTLHDVPALGIEIQSSGRGTDVVLKSLTYSCPYRARHTVAPVPAGWHTVIYEGLRFEVPSDWPVHDISGSSSAGNPGLCNTATSTAPALVLGVSSAPVPSCAYDPLQPGTPPIDGLWIRAPGREATPPTSELRHQNGLEIALDPTDPTQPLIGFTIHTPAGQLDGTLGTGSDARVAAAVLESIQRA